MSALSYFFGHRAINDVQAIVKNRVNKTLDILFFAGSQVDLQWIVPLYDTAIAHDLRCALAGPDLSVPPDAIYVDVSVHLLRLIKTRILVTSTSGLKAKHMPISSIRRVSIPHSLISLHMAYPEHTFTGYTDVFCCGSHHVAEVEAMNRHEGISERRAVNVGYGKCTQPPNDISQTQFCNGSPRHVLIGPSWGAGNILETIGLDLVKSLLSEGYRVTLRPHPSFFLYGNEQIAPMTSLFGAHQLFSVENSLKESIALWTADLMISDYSGFAMEFSFLRERPVLYVDVPPKVLNKNWASLGLNPLELSVREKIGLVVPSSVKEVMAGLQRIEKMENSWMEKIRSERRHRWFNFGKFDAVGAEELVHMLMEINH